ncbi:hypothetical protein BDP27DRAFT_757271 [Rhodocollybia butyracea]|uniref:Uncharacterized protein n=1 Tax=Rhodocollybia butyracea TaxID=206335 RepID=A0A9P5PN60_9AGAR|nr:hypothetical protein BDP27DRAFT_757271 [Rhodocollybia butyracea]
MATPSSSATSPSPPISYLQPIPVSLAGHGHGHGQGPMMGMSMTSSSSSTSSEPAERERRKKAVQKFLARAELSNVTRTLRTRLSHATNSNPSSFGDVEASSSSAPRSYTAKRKAPASRGPSPRAEPYSHNHTTLFTSILAPPPSNQARTIFNANDPPVPAPVRPSMSPKIRNAKVVRSIAESTRAHAKSRKLPDKDKEKRKERGKGRKSVGDVDMEAAATLTSLLLHNRPSIADTTTTATSATTPSTNTPTTPETI